MGHWLIVILLVSSFYPLARGWWSIRRTTLVQSATWLIAAWLLWVLVHVAIALQDVDQANLGRYLALCVTGCAGVAVLGARRPGVGPWNAVVCGLLAILILPVVDLFEMRLRVETLQRIFLGAILLVGITNYLPTRAGLAALLAGAGCGLAFAEWETAGICLGLAPWLGWAMLRRPRAGREADRVWLGFRDSFGVVWGQRVREQMNRAAANGGWPVILTWFGFQDTGTTPPNEQQLLDTLRAALKRFEIEDH